MATTKFQRWGILTIVVVTVIGTIGGFAVMVLAQQQASEQQAKLQQLSAKYQKESEERNKKIAAQDDALSVKYYDTFVQYENLVSPFDINVKELSTEDVVVGDGAEVTGESKMVVYYIGWDANGHEFDKSIDEQTKKLKNSLYHTTQAPMLDQGLDNASLIEGWKEGMKGMKIGGVRVITIPSDKAYGEQGSKDSSGKETIAPNMPLKFVVMAIPAPEAIAQPDTTELMNLYSQMNQ